VIKYVVETIVRLIAPFAPHVCEELWERMGGSGFVSVARYPAVDQTLVDDRIEIAENFIKGVVADTSEITRVTGLVPTKICYYTAPRWKWDAYLKAMRIVESGADPKQLVREAMRDPDIRGRGGEAAKFIGSVSQCIVSMQRRSASGCCRWGGIDEPEALKSSLPFCHHCSGAVWMFTPATPLHMTRRRRRGRHRRCAQPYMLRATHAPHRADEPGGRGPEIPPEQGGTAGALLRKRVVGDHFALGKLERIALYRCVHSSEEARRRSSKLLLPERLQGRRLALDGFNVMWTIYWTIGGHPLLLCDDGVVRDITVDRGSLQSRRQA